MGRKVLKISGALVSIMACLTIGTGIGMAIQPQDTYNDYNIYVIDDEEYQCVEIYLENVNTSWDHWIYTNHYEFKTKVIQDINILIILYLVGR